MKMEDSRIRHLEDRLRRLERRVKELESMVGTLADIVAMGSLGRMLQGAGRQEDNKKD